MKKFIGLFLVLVCCLLTFGSIGVLQADEVLALKDAPPEDFALEDIASQDTGLREDSIPNLVSTIIQWVLGLIGVILVALIVYGGFQYMTSAGDEKKVDSAKKILTYAIVGAVVVFAAFIIARYVISALVSGDDAGTSDEPSSSSQQLPK